MSQPATTRTMVVTDPIGFHARIAVGVAKVVRGSKSEVTLIKDERRAPGTEVLQMLSLYVPPGESVVVEAVGPDAAAVLDALEALFAGQFGDEPAKNS
jgi:phosphotransferase system HPr (HPr) family protein